MEAEIEDLLSKQTNALSKNQYNVRKTSYKYKIQVKKQNPLKGYIPHMTSAMIEIIRQELNQQEIVELIKPSKSLYALPMVCIFKKNQMM